MSDDVNVRLILNDKKSEILFYDEVNDKSVLVLNDYLGQAIDNSVHVANNNCTKDLLPVMLRIKSGGGDCFGALSVVDYIKRSDVPVHTVVDGFCASAATIISMAGKKRFINKNSFMLIHQISADSAEETLKQMKDSVKNTSLLMDWIIDFYLEHSTFKRKQLKQLLDKDLYLTSDKCLKYGLVDEVI